MPDRKSSRSSLLSRLPQIVFEATGMPLITLLKIVAVLVVAVIGIGLTILYTEADPDGKGSGIEGIDSNRLTSEEQFKAVSVMPFGFAKKRPIEKIGIVNSKIEAGEELVRSGGQYSDRANDQLVSLYGVLCQLQDTEGIDSEKTYARLSELRRQALAEGNEGRVASADFLRTVAATNRLNRFSEQADFRFATDAALSLDSKNLVNPKPVKNLHAVAIKLHNSSSEQDRTSILLSLLGDKLVASPVSEISDLGLHLKDYPQYERFYEEMAQPVTKTRDSKLQVYHELFAEIEKAPPHSPNTYRVIIRLLDRLLNETEAPFAGTLTKRLGKSASMMSPKIKAAVDQSIKNIERRIASLGKTIDLSGSKFGGSSLQLPNDKPTTLVFWRLGNMKSMKHMESLGKSERFDPWETNVLMAGISPLNEAQFKRAEGIIAGKFTVLDNATSKRMGMDLGIDLVPYQVSLDKDGKVIRLGEPTD